MERQHSKLWYDEAVKSLQRRPPEWYTYYIGESYRKATKIALKRVSANMNKINLLKADLWNEGIEVGRDILSQYQDDGNFNLYAVDFSAITCSSAKKRMKRAHIIQSNIRSLPFKDSFFDMILDLSTLDHIPPHQVSSVIQEYERTLRKDGILLLIFWYDSALLRLIFRLRRINYKNQPVGSTQYYFPVALVKSEVEKEFNTLEEFCIAPLLNLDNRVTAPIIENLPKSVYDLILNIEYSKISKYLLKSFAGLYVIIAKRR